MATETDGPTPALGLFLVAASIHSDPSSTISFLIDTGSSLSILPISFKPDDRSRSFTLRTANGNIVQTAGVSTLTFTLPDFPHSFTWSFSVADVTHPILGADFLCANSISVDCRSRHLSMPNFHETCNTLDASPDISSLPDNVRELFVKFPSLLTTDSIASKAGPHTYFHSIITEPTPPLRERVRVLSNEKLDFVRAEFAELLNSGVVRRSSSPWAAPIHVVPKKDGTFRPCGDYRRLNKVTIHDAYPMPLINDVLQRLPNATVFSTLDLRKAYHQIPMTPADICKTAVITPCGLFEYLFMPFGLRNAAQTFQRHIDHVLENLPFALAYIDDILIGSVDADTHKLHLSQILERLCKFKLSINLSKCHFFQTEVTFLGHSISAKGIRPLPRRAETISKFPLPQTVSQLRSFLGTVNYCHRFIPNVSGIASPLSALCTGPKHSTIVWSKSALESFELVKNSLASMKTLFFPKSGLPITLTTDASNFAIGAVLHQLNGDIPEPLEFFSRKFSAAEQRYSTFDRELTAIFISVKHFKHLLEGRTFTIFCDHKPLVHALSMKDPSPRQHRQISYLSQFSCQITHIAGKENIIADYLSRSVNVITHDSFLSHQQLLDNPPSTDDLTFFKDNVVINNGIHFDTALSGTLRAIIGHNLRKSAFDAVHGLHHPGTSATFQILRNQVIWPSMRRDVKLWISQCLECQRYKIIKHTKPPIMHFPTGNRFDTVHIDLVGPLPASRGYTYLLTMIDRKTRWFEVIPLRNITAETVAKNFLQHWISRYGVPLHIISDRGAQFESDLFKNLTDLLHIKRLRTTSYHPQTNGLLERFHRTLKTSLAILSNSYLWSDVLPFVLMGWRNTPSKTTGCSPAQLLFGTCISLPNKLVDFNAEPSLPELSSARDHFLSLDSNPLFSKSYAYQPYVPTSFANATHVWIRKISDTSLKPRYNGPFPLLGLKDNVAFVDVDGSHQTISLSRLKPAFGIFIQDEVGLQDTSFSFPNEYIPFYDPPMFAPPLPLVVTDPTETQVVPTEISIPITVPTTSETITPIETSIPSIVPIEPTITIPTEVSIPPIIPVVIPEAVPVDTPPVAEPFIQPVITRTRRTRVFAPTEIPPADPPVGSSRVLRSSLRSSAAPFLPRRSVSINRWVRERNIDQDPDTPTRLRRAL